MLGIESLELHFPFELNKQTSCSLRLTNETNSYIAFSIHTTSPLPYCIEPTEGIVAPRSIYTVNITLQPLDKAPQDKHHTGYFAVRSTKLNTSENITEDMFKEQKGKLVDEVNLTVTHEPREPHMDLPLEMLTISGTGNLKSLEASSALAEAKSKIRSQTLDELIQFDPPEIGFPFLPNKTLMSSVSIVNITDSYVAFNASICDKVVYSMQPDKGILSPRSSKKLLVVRSPMEMEQQDMQCNDKLFMWNRVVTEGVEASDIVDYLGDDERKKLPIVLNKTSPPCTSEELIRFDPPELCFPFMPNKTMVCSINMVNNTEYSVGFGNYINKETLASYYTKPQRGIMPPRSTQRLVVRRVLKKNELGEAIQGEDKFFIGNMIVTKGAEASDLTDLVFDKGNTQLPIVFEKISSLSTFDELIQFDPPQLRFPFMPTKRVLMMCSIKIINVTDHRVGFNNWYRKSNSACYITTPIRGILAPRSTQELKVIRVPKENESHDMSCTDVVGVWNGVVTEGIEETDLYGYISDEESQQFPIVYTKTSPPYTSEELIRFDPPELSFPYKPNKTMVSSVNMVNNTDYSVGFNNHIDKGTLVSYYTKPQRGIMPPRSTQRLVVRRELRKKEQAEDIQGEGKFFMGNMIVVEGIEASDLTRLVPDKENTMLPIVFQKTSLLSTSDELIQFDPPQLRFPFLPNKRVCMVCSIKIVNVTDHYVGFNNWYRKSNSARYNATPVRGILPPRSTQELKVIRVPKENESQDMPCKDVFGVWNGVVMEGIEATDLYNYMNVEDSKQLPIVYTKTSPPSTSEELIRFDPPELSFPFQPNKTMVASVNMVNNTDYSIGFNNHIDKGTLASYYTKPQRGIMPPRSIQRLVVRRVLKKKEQAEDIQGEDKFFMGNVIVTKGVEASDLSDLVPDKDNARLPIVFEKTSLLCTSDELIRFDPPELCFPFLPNKRAPVLYSVKIFNVTDYCVGFNTWVYPRNSARYRIIPSKGILPPRSTQTVKIKGVPKEKAPEDTRCKDVIGVWNSIVTKGVKASDFINYMDVNESKQLPIVLKKTTLLCASADLIQFDPPELRFPFLPNKRVPMACFIKIVNTTDHCIGFNSWNYKSNSALYRMTPVQGILPPGSTEVLKIKRVARENESGDMQCKNVVFHVWQGIVTKGVEATDLTAYMDAGETIQLPIVFTNTDLLCTSDYLIQFDPPELCFPFLPNKRVPMVCFIKIVNATDHWVGFNSWTYESNSASYYMTPDSTILPPGSTQVLMIKRIANENESEDMWRKDDYFFLWNSIVNEDIEASDLIDCMDVEESKRLPVVFTNTTLSCTSADLVQFDPPELRFPFLPNKRVPMVCFIKIVNSTDHCVGFNSWTYEGTSASYQMTPDPGILTPGSTEVLMIKRVANENESEDMQCKDEFYLWNCIVNEDIEASDLIDCEDEEDSKRLPIVFTNTSLLCTSDDWLQFDPPELHFPFLTNKKVPMVFFIKIVNATNHCVGFNSWTYESTSVSYHMTPDPGILSPGSTQVLMIKMIANENESEDMQCKDNFLYLWNSIVNEDIEASNLIDCEDEEDSKRLPIVFTNASLLCTSENLIQFDPPELRFTLSNNRVSKLCSVEIVNATDHCIGFNAWGNDSNSSRYDTTPGQGILPPRSTQVLNVRRELKEKESKDMLCKDDVYSVWYGIVSEGIKATDLSVYDDAEESKQLPIVFTEPGESSSA
ncbi:uncharacterized protein [Triticum aestivum]|nr:uncharacterized protein LOC123087414 isoform X3 [Triticum aestivum]